MRVVGGWSGLVRLSNGGYGLASWVVEGKV